MYVQMTIFESRTKIDFTQNLNGRIILKLEIAPSMAFPREGNCIGNSMILFFTLSSLAIFGLLLQWPFLDKGIVLEASNFWSCLECLKWKASEHFI